MNPRARQPIESPDQPAAILLASPNPEDHILLPEILKDPFWQWHKSQGCREALELLERQRVAVVLCEQEQLDGCWQDLLNGAAKQAVPSSLIVFSRLADESLWTEVLNLGGYDVLLKPFDPEEVLRIAFLAWLSWKKRGIELASAQAEIVPREQPKELVSAA